MGEIMSAKKTQQRATYVLLYVVLRGTRLNRTYGTHKKLYIYLFLPAIFGPTTAPRNSGRSKSVQAE